MKKRRLQTTALSHESLIVLLSLLCFFDEVCKESHIY